MQKELIINNQDFVEFTSRAMGATMNGFTFDEIKIPQAPDDYNWKVVGPGHLQCLPRRFSESYCQSNEMKK